MDTTPAGSPMRTASKPGDPDRRCVVVEMPGGLVAWAIYRGNVLRGHGTRENADPDEVLADVQRQL